MSALAVAHRAQRSSAAPILCLAAVLAAMTGGWVVLAWRMSGMDMGPGGDPGALGWFTVSWAVMTLAMMLPAAAPAVLRVVRERPARAPSSAALFLAGYVAVWTLAGLLGYAVVIAVRDLHFASLAWSSAGRYVAGGAVTAAGLYQLTRVKRRWLARCVEPESALRTPGRAGALFAGFEHGVSCVACCWTLMAALYALGMMSLAWMALLTVLIASERVVRRRTLAVRTVAAVLVILGIAVAVSPQSVPALSMPPKAPVMGRMS
ncbi:MAG TPA: DUF2182 domain-containing protein [Solirubrobacteraceae bacterium]|jgi:predicted metal-binding membrane protein|nr:DUF2182 domain-containing protein [Solirubrobacteraceae bacterium]